LLKKIIFLYIETIGKPGGFLLKNVPNENYCPSPDGSGILYGAQWNKDTVDSRNSS